MGNREEARRLLIKGDEAARDKTHPTNLDHGYQLLASACYTDPTWGAAFYANGCAASDLLRPHAATALFRRALENGFENNNEKAKALTNLAWELMKFGGQQEAIGYLHEAIELDKSLALPWMHLGLCHTTFGMTQTAVSCARKCMEISPPDDSTAEFQLAFALLFNGNYAEGLKHFESRFAARLHNFLSYPYPKWRGENGKTLFLVAAQGLGDTLSYSPFVESTSERCKHIHMCLQSEF